MESWSSSGSSSSYVCSRKREDDVGIEAQVLIVVDEMELEKLGFEVMRTIMSE